MALQEEMEDQGNWLFKYRGYLPIVILFVALVVFLFPNFFNIFSFLENINKAILQWIFLSISMFGLLIRIYTVGYTPKNTSGRNVEGQLAETLNTSGIYSTVRHPLYLGNFFMWLGPALLTENFWFIISFCFFYCVYYERIMFSEEQFLRKKFGATYLEWASRTPAFSPKCKNFTKSNLTFSWKKVLKKEKNGLVAVFIIFSLFDFLGKWINQETDYNYSLYQATILSVVIYLVLKILKNNTKLLDEAGR